MAVEKLERQAMESAIGGHVLDRLGRPDAPHAIRVRHLWGDNYRVNVLLGEATAFAEIAHSYFLTVDGAGAILTATPPIRKRY